MYGSGRCSVISFILFYISLWSLAKKTLPCFLYVLMLRYKYVPNMFMQLFISFSIGCFLVALRPVREGLMQKLYVSPPERKRIIRELYLL